MGNSAAPVNNVKWDTSKPPVSPWFMFVYSLTVFAVYMALFTPLLATLAVRVGQIADAADKATSLGAVLAPGAFAALISAPIFGAISDRTRSRFGRRKLWIGIGCLLTFAGLMTMALGTSLLALGVGWFVVQVGANSAIAGATALIADQVPEYQRGRMAALLGVGLSCSFVVGTWVSQFTLGNNLAMFLVPWSLFPVAVVLLFAAFKDRPAERFPPLTIAGLLRIFWVNPLKYPDFGWAFVSRFLVFMGVAYFLSYQFVFLKDHLHFTEAEALRTVTLATLVTAIASFIFTPLCGWISDRIGRRKPIVFVAGLLVAAGLVVIAYSPNQHQFLVGAAIYGAGQAIYYAVDLALVAAVLPHPDDTAKDMGVFNIASTLPQTIAPVIAPLFLAVGAVPGGNYPVTFVAGAIFAVLGAIAVAPIVATR
jgi:MFS family permease